MKLNLPLPPTMNPVLALFIRLTAIVAIVLIGLWLAAIVFKVVIVAALIAAVILGGFLIYRVVTKRRAGPLV